MMQQVTVPLNQKEIQLLLPKLHVTRFVGKASAMAAWLAGLSKAGNITTGEIIERNC